MLGLQVDGLQRLFPRSSFVSFRVFVPVRRAPKFRL